MASGRRAGPSFDLAAAAIPAGAGVQRRGLRVIAEMAAQLLESAPPHNLYTRCRHRNAFDAMVGRPGGGGNFLDGFFDTAGAQQRDDSR
jgi:hypothetical protein